MIKKKTAFIFVLLANIVLLAHAVVPHHHHHNANEICISTSDCETDCKEHKHITPACTHGHENNEKSECCTLNQFVVIPATSIRQENNWVGCPDNKGTFDDFQAILFYYVLKADVPILETDARLQFTTSFFTQFVVSSLGLRAPPTV
jgi:hypothetical protein